MRHREKTFETLNEMRYQLRDLSEMASNLHPSPDFKDIRKSLTNLRIAIEQKLRDEINQKPSISTYQKAMLNLNTSLTKPERVAEDLTRVLNKIKNKEAHYRLWCFINVLQLESNKPLIADLEVEKGRVYVFCTSLLKLPASVIDDHITTDMTLYRFKKIFKSKVLLREYELSRTVL